MANLISKNERFGDAGADLAHKREVRRNLLDFATGKGASGWVVEFTLDATGATSTTVPSAAATATSQVSLSPTTAEAAALAGNVWVASLTPNTEIALGSFTVGHPAILAGVVATFRASVKG